LDKLKILSTPLLVGVSRKSMIRNIIGDGENDIIQASVIMAVLSVLRGAKIVRVHDVRETKIALKTLQLKDN
jgi:dihydropteroate synthase